MLTEKTFSSVSQALTHSTCLRMLPFSWNSKTFKLVPSSRPSYLFYSTLTVYLCMYSIFIWLQYYLHRESFKLVEHQAQGVLQLNFGLVYNGNILLTLNAWLYRDQIAILFNCYFPLIRQLDEFVSPEHKNRKSNHSELFLQTLLSCTYIHSLITTVLFFEDPTSPRYWFYLLSPSYQSSIWLLLSFGMLEFFGYIAMWHITVFSLLIFLCYFQGLIQWLCEIHSQKGGSQTDKRFCNPNNSFLVYRSFQLLTQQFNCCFSTFAFPFIMILVIAIPVVTNNITIQHWHELSLLVTIALCSLSFFIHVCVLIIFPYAARLNTLSAAYLMSLRRASVVTNSSLLKSQIKSSWPLKIKYNSFGFIQKFTTLKIVALIFYWTLKSLLLSRK